MFDSENNGKILPCGHEVFDAAQTHYCEYISLERLLALLQPNAAERKRDFLHHDEFQFVGAHQIAEIGFAIHLHTLRAVIAALGEMPDGDSKRACTLLDRLIVWTRQHAAVVKVFHTMHPHDFGKFRSALAPASGAESISFRMIEILSGIRPDSPYAEYRRRVYTFREFLDRSPGPDPNEPKVRWWIPAFDDLARDVSLTVAFDLAVLRAGASIEVMYANDPERGWLWLRELADRVHAYDRAFVEYRYAHAAMAKAIIGKKSGTGHTSGVPYLLAVAETARFHPVLYRFKEARHPRLPESAWGV